MQTNLRTERHPAADVLPNIESHKRKSAAAETAEVASVLTAGEAPQAIKQLDAKALQKLLQTAEFIEPEESPLDTDAQSQALEARETVAKAEASLRRQLSGVVDNASRTAIATLVAYGLSLEKISLDVLNEVLAEIEANPDVETADEFAVRARVAVLTEDYNLLPEVAKRFDEYAMKLAGAGAAVTVRNLLALENADSMYARLSDMTDAEIVSVLREDAPLTLEYAHNQRFRVPQPKTMPDTDWAKLASSVRRSLAREDVPDTVENLDTARLLLANGAAVSKTNLDNARFLRQISRELSRDTVLSRGAAQLAKHESAVSFLIIDDNPADTSALQDDNVAVAEALPLLTPSHIDLALLQSMAPTLGTLRALSNAFVPETPGFNEDAIRFKRQLMELQVTMTREAALRLARKGFRLETALPEEALAALRMLETEDAASTLRQAGAPDSPQNVTALMTLSGQLKSFRLLPAMAYPVLLENRTKLTPAFVSRMAALESYDLAATPVSAKYGDSFANVADQFASLLEAMNLPATEENLRAARLLSRSQTDITPDAIFAVRGLNAQLEHVASRLHPFLTARLLKDGYDPSALTLDELTAHIASFEAENGKTDVDHLAAHIAALDRQNTLSPQEREALLDVYRALHKAQANDSAALGAAIRAGRTLTLSNLAETADAFRAAAGRFSAVDITLADDEANRHASTHTETAFLARHMVSKVVRHALPALLHGLLRQNGDAWPLDTVADFLAETKNTSVDTEKSVQDMLLSAEHISAASAAFLQACGVPLTLPNLLAYRKLTREPDALEELLNESTAIETLTTALPDDTLTSLKEGESPAEMLGRLADLAAQAQEADVTKPLDAVVRTLRLQSAIAAATRSYHIPVNRNGKTADVHIYMLNEQADEATVNMALSLGTRLGTVLMHAIVTDSVLSIEAQANGDGASALASHTAALANGIAETGWSFGHITVEDTGKATAGGKSTAQQISRRLHSPQDGGAVPPRIFTLAAALLEWIQQAETDFGSTETDFNADSEGAPYNEN